MIQAGLAAGGVDWPELDGLPGALAQLEPAPTLEPSPDSGVTDEAPSESKETGESSTEMPASAAEGTDQGATDVAGSPEPGYETETETEVTGGQLGPENIVKTDLNWRECIMRDPLGNSISVVLLFGLVLSLVAAWRRWRSEPEYAPEGWQRFAVPAVSLLGIAVAGYMTYVEFTGLEAVCGPVGDCNTVQQSEYATLLGVLPVGLFGLLGYIAILAAWFTAEQGREKLSDRAAVAVLLFSAFGVLFSIYLTFLEPFVICATCAWCLTSAVLITIIMWFAVDPAAVAWRRLQAG
jgi:uncharacterized membrane protein